MKLLIAIVQDADAAKLPEELTRNGFKSTKLVSTGGYLRQGNTTFLIGVEDSEEERVKELIGKTCKERTTHIPQPPIYEAGVLPTPVEIIVGGAVVFVLPLDELLRL